MPREQVTIGSKRYTIELKVNSLQHLCTFRELSDYKLTVEKKNERFDTFSVITDPLSEDEVNLVTSLFAKTIRKANNIGCDVKGFIATMSTGNHFNWSYTREQKHQFEPIFNKVVADSSMVMYRIDKGDDKYVELTMFNFNLSRINELKDKFESYKRVLTDQLPSEESAPVTTELTEASIRAYLRQGT